MQRMPQCAQRGFLHCLAQGRVGVDGASNVLQARTHFQRLAKGRGQFRHTRTDGLPTHNQVIVTPRHHPHEAAFGLQGHGSPIGRKREAGAQAIQPCSLSLGRGLADHDDFRVGETHGRDRRRAEFTLLASNDLGHHFPLRHGAMGQHRLAGQVANRPDVAHAGLAAVVDTDRRAVHGQGEGFQIETLRARATADRHQHLIGFQRLAFPHAIAHRQGAGAGLEPFDAVFQVQRDAQRFEGFGNRLRQLHVIGGQDALAGFDHRDFRAQLAVGDPQLKPDVTGAHHGQAFGNVRGVQCFGGRNNGAAQWQYRQIDRF